MHSLTSSIPQRRNVREVSSELCSTPSACHNAQERRVLLALSVQARFVLQFQRSHHAPIFLPTVPILSSHSTRGLRCAPAQPGAPVHSCSSCLPAAKMSRAPRGRCETVESGAPMRRDLDGGEAQHHLAEEAGEQAAAVGAQQQPETLLDLHIEIDPFDADVVVQEPATRAVTESGAASGGEYLRRARKMGDVGRSGHSCQTCGTWQAVARGNATWQARGSMTGAWKRGRARHAAGA